MIISTFKNSEQKHYIIAAVLFVIALLIRLGYLIDLQTHYAHFLKPPQGLDQHTYLHIAQKILTGQFTQPHYMAPGYPLYFLVPALYIFKNIGSIKICQAVLSALCVPLLYESGRHIYSPTTAFIAASLMCISYLHIGFTGFLLTENIIIFLLCLLLVLMAHYQAKNHQTLLIGLIIGLTLTVRPNMAFVCFIFFVYLWYQALKKSQMLWILFIGFSLPILPIMHHNIQTKSTAPISNNLMPNLTIGLNPDANGVFEYAPAYQNGWITSSKPIKTPTDIIVEMIKHPSHYLLFSFQKALMTIDAKLYADTLSYKNDIGTTFLKTGTYTTQFWHLIILAIPSLIFFKRARNPQQHFIIILCTASFLLPLICFFFISSRLTFPIAPFLALVAGFGLEQGLKAWQSRHIRSLCIYGCIFLIMACLSYKGYNFYQKHLHPHLYTVLHAKGTHRIYENNLLIKDVWWPALIPQQRTELHANRSLRKTLLISPFLLSKLKENSKPIIGFPILFTHPPPESTTLTISFNNQHMALDWHAQDLEQNRWKTLKLPIEYHLLQEGINEIDLTLTKGKVAIGWDSRLHYNRSFEKTSKTWQPITQTGELQIILESNKP